MSERLNRFLGDTPVRVILKLLVLSLVAGVIMSALHWTPYDVFYAFRDFVLHIWNMGFKAIHRFADYIVLGAVVIVPLFLILRILSYRR